MHCLDKNHEFLLYKFAFEEVDEFWMEMGISLNFKTAELNAIDEKYFQLGTKHKAWAVLQRHFQWRGEMSLECYRSILSEVKLRNKKTTASSVPNRIHTNHLKTIQLNVYSYSL